MKWTRHIFFLMTAMVLGNAAMGQALKADTAFTADYLVDKIFTGKGMRVGNVKMTGRKSSMCYFSSQADIIGMKSGVMLSTGSVFDIAGENKVPGTSGIAWDYTKNKRYVSDRDLNVLCRGRTYDQVILEFDFVPYDNFVSFRFSFASEEYKEYVGSAFNDVFAFIISGEGIRKKNLAVIPGTTEPVTINNINHKNHKDLFINNDYFVNYKPKKTYGSKQAAVKKGFWKKLFKKKNKEGGFYYSPRAKRKLNQNIVSNLGYDGLTKVLTASCYLKPWKLYHLKIAIGDVGDAIFDSGVFLEEGSFTSARDTTEPNFKPYPDLRNTVNWDQIFGLKKIPPVVSDSITAIDEAFEITNINFDTDEYVIPDTSKQKLTELAGYLLKNPELKLRLLGYTDNQGTKKYNQVLSENRAIAVMNYLTTKGIPASRMRYEGYNFEDPLADNITEKGRAANRRVEIILVEE